MPLREFVPRDGQMCRVWDTRPDGGLLSEALRAGWLTFECADRRRRLAPIPFGWEMLDEVALTTLWISATPLPVRPRPIE